MYTWLREHKQGSKPALVTFNGYITENEAEIVIIYYSFHQLYRGVNKIRVYLDTHFHAKFNENNAYFVHNLYNIFMFNNVFSVGDKKKL
jgi:hypothetical protein